MTRGSAAGAVDSGRAAVGAHRVGPASEPFVIARHTTEVADVAWVEPSTAASAGMSS